MCTVYLHTMCRVANNCHTNISVFLSVFLVFFISFFLSIFLFIRCSDPSKKTKEACMKAGDCADPRFHGRSECMNGAGGICKFKDKGFRPSAPIRTWEECEDANARVKIVLFKWVVWY